MVPLLVLTSLSACGNESVALVVTNARIYTVDAEQSRAEALAIKESIDTYTVNAAWQLRQEDKTGTPEEGQRADFIGLEQNLFEIEPERISQTKVILAVVDGRIVYERQ